MRTRIKYLSILLVLLLTLAACHINSNWYESSTETPVITEVDITDAAVALEEQKAANFDISQIPEFNGSPIFEVNNVPFFDEEDISNIAFETYSPRDELGRCGIAYANICKEIMPDEEREAIGHVKPTGWIQKKYDREVTGMDSPYLYNRCHLIAFELAGENDNEDNLITGTRYMNVKGMLPFENKIAKYVRETNNHVLYRVTPVFEGDNLLASGVLLEAKSVEDDGCIFCVYCYNAEPGIEIDYKTGDSTGPEFTGTK